MLEIEVVLTESRIKKGLLAISRKWKGFFPSEAKTIKVVLGSKCLLKRFVPFQSSTREMRICGLKRWYEENEARPGDLVKIKVIEPFEVYELKFIPTTPKEVEFQKKIFEAEDESIASEILRTYAKAFGLNEKIAATKSLQRLAASPIPIRKSAKIESTHRLKVSPGIRKLLLKIYNGHCQICGFTFLKRDGTPYFEVHHIDPQLGDHPKNLLVVCPNHHAMLEFAHTKIFVDKNGWTREVEINGSRFRVKQLLDKPLDLRPQFLELRPFEAIFLIDKAR